MGTLMPASRSGRENPGTRLSKKAGWSRSPLLRDFLLEIIHLKQPVWSRWMAFRKSATPMPNPRRSG
jgi:hypothetical protein